MNNSFSRLIDGMNATLRQEVLPQLHDEFARGQVYGIINLLNTFKVRANWSRGFLQEQVRAQFEAIESFVRLAHEKAPAARLPDLPDLPQCQPPHCPGITDATVERLLLLRDECNGAICTLLGWLEDHHQSLGSDVSGKLSDVLRQAMRAELLIELKNSPLPLFAQMSSGQED